MDNLESAIAEVQEEIAQVRLTRAELDQTLEALETRWRMLEGKPPEISPPPLPSLRRVCGLSADLRQDCPLDAMANR